MHSVLKRAKILQHARKIGNSRSSTFGSFAHLLEKMRCMQDMKNLVVVDDNHKPVAVVCQVLLVTPTSDDYNLYHGESVSNVTKADLAVRSIVEKR